MGYIGNEPSVNFTSFAKQDITGDGGANYTLTHAVANENEIEVFVNNVRQEPSVAYSVSGTALTMTGNVASTDDFYVIYLGKALQTTTPPDGSVTSAKLDTNIAIDGDLTVDTSTLKVDSTNNRVGISNASPSTPLDVGGHIRVTGGNDCDIEFQLGSARRKFIGGDGNELELGTYSSSNTSRDVKMTLDSAGNVLVGTTSTNPHSAGDTVYGTQIHPTLGLLVASNGSHAGIFARKQSDGEIVRFQKNNTTVGSINSRGGEFIAVGYSDTYLEFNAGSNQINPSSGTGSRDNAIDLGSSGSRFDDIFATNGTIQTSDRNEKQDIEELSDAEQRVAVVAKGLMRKFRWIDSVAEKGDNARTHFGIIAQDLQDAFTAEGLDAGDYAMFISDTWTDDDGNEQTRLGVRYSELLAFIISAL